MNQDQRDAPRLVRDLMTVGVPTCSLDTIVADLAELMLAKDYEGVIVLDANGHAAGVVTRDELVKAYCRLDAQHPNARHPDYQHQRASEVMRADVPQIPPDIPLSAAAQIMHDLGVRVLYLMHHAGGIEYPAAYLTYRHLIRHICAKEDSDLSDLGIKAARKAPLELFIERREEARKKAMQSKRK
jgi:CBS domain-containing protein